ncbi:hypothetical protein Bbelb_083690 [Branchiostoma belcheri]|nr:hypothetical protein Bbelb_083690 [Branchiostoma belcheri]
MSTQGVKRCFIFIKNKVSSDWKDLAWCLGFDTPDIENIEGKRRDDKSRCMELLQEWHKRKGNAATIHVLMEALKDAELQHVVDSLKEKYPGTTLHVCHMCRGDWLHNLALSLARNSNLPEGRLELYYLCKNESVPDGETPVRRRPCPSLAGNGVLTVPTQLAASTNSRRTAVPEISDGTPSLPARPEPGKIKMSTMTEHPQRPVRPSDTPFGPHLCRPKRTGSRPKQTATTNGRLNGRFSVGDAFIFTEINGKQRSSTSSSKQLPELPVHLNLGTVQQQTARERARDIDIRVSKRLLKLERTLFTKDVLKDRRRYNKAQKLFLSHKAFLLKEAVKGSFILLLTFLRQTDVDRFYHNHYRVGEGTLSQQLSHILISDDLQDKVKGAQLIVRLQVKHEDYEQVRDRLGQGLDRTTSANNLLTLPPTSRHVERSSLRGLDLAVIGREDQPYKDSTDDITMPYRQVQEFTTTLPGETGEEFKPHDVAVDRNDNLWVVDGMGNILVTDVNNHCVHVLDREGNFKFKFGSEGSDKSGDVVMTDYLSNTVSVWTQG